MALKLEDKKAIVAEVADQASLALSAAVADYRGLTVNQMSDGIQKAGKLNRISIKSLHSNSSPDKQQVEGDQSLSMHAQQQSALIQQVNNNNSTSNGPVIDQDILSRISQ